MPAHFGLGNAQNHVFSHFCPTKASEQCFSRLQLELKTRITSKESLFAHLNMPKTMCFSVRNTFYQHMSASFGLGNPQNHVFSHFCPTKAFEQCFSRLQLELKTRITSKESPYTHLNMPRTMCFSVWNNFYRHMSASFGPENPQNHVFSHFCPTEKSILHRVMGHFRSQFRSFYPFLASRNAPKMPQNAPKCPKMSQNMCKNHQ